MSALQANPFLFAGGDDGYVIERSLRFFDDNSAYLKRTMGTPTSSGTWTWSGWVKRSELGTNQAIAGCFGGSINTTFYFDTYDKLFFSDYNVEFHGTVRFRDVGAWYHICIAHSASTSITIYVNGAQVHQRTSNVPSVSRFNHSGGTANIGTRHRNTNTRDYYYHGYIAEVNFIDGQALGPTNFGEFDDLGNWQALAYSGTYGNNGYYLNFSDNSSTSTIGADSSGNSNNFTSHNISVSSGAGNDSVLDSPTDNYCTLNQSYYTNGQAEVKDGALYFITGARQYPVMGTMLIPPTGKYYFEVKISNANEIAIGLTNHQGNTSGTQGIHLMYSRTTLQNYGYYINGVNQGNSGSPLAVNDIVGVAINADNSQISWYKNGSLVKGNKTFTNTHQVPYVSTLSGSGNCQGTINFGQQPFTYTVSGYNALCTSSMSTPDIEDPSTQFDAKLYTGNGGSNHAITGMNMSPDFLWIKTRDHDATHMLMDTIRGADKMLGTNANFPESTVGSSWQSTWGNLDSFDSNGFTVTNGSSGDGNFNSLNRPYVAWAWESASSTSSNTDGSITTQVRANPTAGFSIVTYTGTGSSATIGHGLNAAPDLVIIKCRSNGYSWIVWHSVFVTASNTDNLFLSANGARGSYNYDFWNNTAPTSSVVNLGTQVSVNANTATYVAYCFTSIPGYSSFGKFEGNGSYAKGPYINCGFTPRWALLKDYNDTNPWHMWDSAREPFNHKDKSFLANYSWTENDEHSDEMDFLSYGFRPAGGQNSGNGNGTLYVYAAFADHPFKYARAH